MASRNQASRPAQAWHVDEGALNSVAAILTATRRLEDQTSARAVLASAEGLTNIVDIYAHDARSAVRKTTLALASELHTYVGWLKFSSGREQHAGRHWDAAIALALEIDHPDHLAHAASFKGYEALLAGNLDRAINLSTLSLRDKRVFMALRVFDGYQLSHAYALQGEHHQAAPVRTTRHRSLGLPTHAAGKAVAVGCAEIPRRS